MSACANTNGNDSIDTLLDCLARVAHVDDIVKNESTVAVNGCHYFFGWPQTSDDDRHFVTNTDFHVGKQALVALVCDLIDGERRHWFVRIVLAMLGQPIFYLADPVIEHFLRSCIKCRKGADNTRSTLGDDKVRVRNDEHRRANQRQAQISLECSW